MGSGLLAPACNDTYNSLPAEHSQDLAPYLVYKLTSTKLNPKWNTVQKPIYCKRAYRGAKDGLKTRNVKQSMEQPLYASSFIPY